MASSRWVDQYRLRMILVVVSMAGILGAIALPWNVGMRSVLVIEAVITTAVLLIAMIHPAVVQLLRRTPKRYIALTLALLACLLGGQWMNQSSRFYPFCEWGMYSSASDARTQVTYEGVHVVRKDGRQEYLIPENYVVTPRKLLPVVYQAGLQAANGTPQVQFDQTPEHVRRMFGHLIDLKNQSAPQNPVVSVIGSQYVVPLHGDGQAATTGNRQMWEVCID
jgi:hypothetical protein